MLRELFELVKGNARETVIDNPEIPNEQNNEVIAEATNTVASGMRNMVAGGGIQNLLSLFKKDNTNRSNLLGNPIVSMMMGHFASKLMNKFGLNNNQANRVSGTLIPDVFTNLINRTNDPNDSQFSLENLIGSITGNKSLAATREGGGLSDLLAGLSGGQSVHGNGLLDVIKNMAGGAQIQQKNNGNLLELIKGFGG